LQTYKKMQILPYYIQLTQHIWQGHTCMNVCVCPCQINACTQTHMQEHKHMCHTHMDQFGGENGVVGLPKFVWM
jgi:hypothetical protein